MLSLLLNSEAYMNTFIKVLNKAYVFPDISIGQLDHLVNNIMADNYISFSDDEIPQGGRGNHKALHITTYSKRTILPNVLIDNGSVLNVMLMSCLSKFLIDMSYIQNIHTFVQAFDGTCRNVVENVIIPF